MIWFYPLNELEITGINSAYFSFAAILQKEFHGEMYDDISLYCNQSNSYFSRLRSLCCCVLESIYSQCWYCEKSLSDTMGTCIVQIADGRIIGIFSGLFIIAAETSD